jgi:small subunit ribosomal protein S9
MENYNVISANTAAADHIVLPKSRSTDLQPQTMEKLFQPTLGVSVDSDTIERYFVGRRKPSVAKVFLVHATKGSEHLKGMVNGAGQMIINGQSGWKYFVLNGSGHYYSEAIYPLESLNLQDSYHVIAWVRGGGLRGQAGAIRFGLVRALCYRFPERRSDLRSSGFLSSDSRRKERKKYGLKKARKAPQFSKR